MSKRVSKNFNTLLLESLSIKPIGFNPLLAKLAGSATAGLFMSQLLYWWGKGDYEDWIYKTIDEVKKETCLTRSEQSRAIKRWVVLGVLKVKIAGIPARRFFQIDTKKLVTILKKISGVKSDSTNLPAENDNQADNIQQGNTDSTQRVLQKSLLTRERAADF